MTKNINNTLLKILSNALFNAEQPINLDNINFEELFEESLHQTVLAIVFDALPVNAAKNDIEVYNKWQMYSFKVLQQNLRLAYKNSELTKLLQKENIEHTILKGLASSMYYPKPNLRQMGDIDFLIYERDVKKTLDVLQKNGFVIPEHEHNHDFHIELKKEGIIYELHTKISSFSKDQDFVLDYLKTTIANSEIADVMDFSVRLPDPFHNGLIQLLHLHRHIVKGEGIGLRHLCDWAVFVNSFTNQDWCMVFENKLKEIGLWRFAQVLSYISYKYLKMPYKDWIKTIEDDVAEELLNDILEGGNFGIKDSKRYYDSFLVEKGSKNHSMFVVFFLSVNARIYSWKPFYKKNKWLLPIGYICYIFRMISLFLFNKKEIDFVRIYSKGTQRNNLYRKLRFFEKEK